MYKPNVDYIIKQLITICNIPSPSGNTGKVTAYLEAELDNLGMRTTLSNKGTLIATLTGTNSKIHRTVAVHVDTLGAMVKEIKQNGRLRLSPIGSYGWGSVEGETCFIETHSSTIFTGTILNTHASAHVYKDYIEQKRNEENMEVRLDEKAVNSKDVRSLGIEVGDFVSFEPRTRVSQSGFVCSRHLDDKAGVAILLEVIRYFKEQAITLPYTTNFIFSNNEEVGYGGNSSISPETKEFLAIDMGAIGEGQATDEFCVSICAKDSLGPYHYELRKKLVDLALANKTHFKVDIYPDYFSDATSALRAGYDIVHGLIGPGIDASHGYERTHKEALYNTAWLLLSYLGSK